MTHIKRVNEMYSNPDTVFAELAQDNLSVIIEDATLSAEQKNRGIDSEFDYAPNEMVGLIDFMQRCADVAETSNGYYTITPDETNKRYVAEFFTTDLGGDEMAEEAESIGSIAFHILYFANDFDIQETLVSHNYIER